MSNKSLKSLSLLIFLLFLLNSVVKSSSFTTKLKSFTSQASPILLDQKTKAIIQGPYVEIEYIQTYNNPFNKALEIAFYFPRPANSVFLKFEAIFSNHTVVSKIFEKTKAQEFISRREKDKNPVTLSHRSSWTSEPMPAHIGMIQAHENVEIRFSFIQPVIFNQFWSFTLPFPSTENNTPWSIEVEIKSDQPFRTIRNPSHNHEPEFFKQSSKLYTAVWNTTIAPQNKDFVVEFLPFEIDSPSSLLATHPNYPNDHVLLVNFIPQLYEQVLEKGGEEGLLQLKDQICQEDMQNSKAEFIFLIDCSFSMSGEKIDKLRKTLDRFLTILPKNSFFNIISFGSSSTFYSPESLQSSPKNIWKAKIWINLIDADMEGTEILSALQQAIHAAPLIPGHQRAVIILSDGIGFEPAEVISFVKTNANSAKVCGLGIRNGISTFFMKNIGKAGGCFNEPMLEKKVPEEDKESFLIRAAITPSLENIQYKIKCWNSQGQFIFTDESQQKVLFRNKALKKWFYFANISGVEYCIVTIRYDNMLLKKKTTQEIRIDGFKSAEVTSVWHKVAYKSKIDELLENRAVWNSEEIDRKIIELSTKYKIFSDYVAFLTVQEENIGNPQEIPKVISADQLSLSAQTENRQRSERSIPIEKIIEILQAKKVQLSFPILEIFFGFLGSVIICFSLYFFIKNEKKEGKKKENFYEILGRLTHTSNI